MTTIGVFAHEVCDVSARDEDARRIFCPGACSRGKISTLNLVRTESPTHTEVRVLMVFVNNKHRIVQVTQIRDISAKDTTFISENDTWMNSKAQKSD